MSCIWKQLPVPARPLQPDWLSLSWRIELTWVVQSNPMKPSWICIIPRHDKIIYWTLIMSQRERGVRLIASCGWFVNTPSAVTQTICTICTVSEDEHRSYMNTPISCIFSNVCEQDSDMWPILLQTLLLLKWIIQDLPAGLSPWFLFLLNNVGVS